MNYREMKIEMERGIFNSTVKITLPSGCKAHIKKGMLEKSIRFENCTTEERQFIREVVEENFEPKMKKIYHQMEMIWKIGKIAGTIALAFHGKFALTGEELVDLLF